MLHMAQRETYLCLSVVKIRCLTVFAILVRIGKRLTIPTLRTHPRKVRGDKTGGDWERHRGSLLASGATQIHDMK